MSEFLPTSGFKWIDSKSFDLNKYAGYSSNRRLLKVDPEYFNELPVLHNGYPLGPDKIEIKREMLSDLYNLPISNVKNLVLHYLNMQLYLSRE